MARWIAGTVLVLAAAAGTGWYAVDWKTRAFLEMEYCVEHQLWEEVLTKARKLPEYSPFTSHEVNLALYHTGRLPYDMFSYPQQNGILLDQQQLPAGALKMLRKPCHLLLELGRVNEAEHAALELLELCPTGRTLKELALIKMIKNETGAAKLFLSVLRDDIVFRDWAEERLQRLTADPELTQDEEVQRIRRLMIKEDDLQATCTIESGDFTVSYPTMLLGLLKQNDGNRMAFEYLMAIYLLECNLPAAVELFPFLDRIRYPALPPCYEETALLYGSTHPREIRATPTGLFFHGHRISESTLNKYKRLQVIVTGAGGSIQRARPDLLREMGDSYFTYFLTHSGKPRE